MGVPDSPGAGFGRVRRGWAAWDKCLSGNRVIATLFSELGLDGIISVVS